MPGVRGVLGGAPARAEFTLDHLTVLWGRTVRGILGGEGRDRASSSSPRSSSSSVRGGSPSSAWWSSSSSGRSRRQWTPPRAARFSSRCCVCRRSGRHEQARQGAEDVEDRLRRRGLGPQVSDQLANVAGVYPVNLREPSSGVGWTRTSDSTFWRCTACGRSARCGAGSGGRPGQSRRIPGGGDGVPRQLPESLLGLRRACTRCRLQPPVNRGWRRVGPACRLAVRSDLAGSRRRRRRWVAMRRPVDPATV
jgi:hypothetical protein